MTVVWRAERLRYLQAILFACLALWSSAAGSAPARADGATNINLFHYSQDRIRDITQWETRSGDESTWADRQVDERGWTNVADIQDEPARPGIRWYRAVVQLEGRQDELDVLALSFYRTVSAFELYWDGELVQRCGTVGCARDEEVPGPIWTTVPLPSDRTTPGRHVIAIRLSNFHTTIEQPLGSITIGYHYEFLYDYSYKTSHRVFVGGAYLITALLCIALFFAGSRHRSYLLFALFCLISLFFDLYSMLSLYNEISVAHLSWIAWLFRYGEVVSKLLLVLFVVYTYGIPRKAIVLPLAILAFVVSIGLRQSALWPSILSAELLPAFAGGLLIWAVSRRATGGPVALAGLLVWRLLKYPQLLPVPDGAHLYCYIFSDIFLLFCIVQSISRIIHEQNAQLYEIRLRSARLEAELLRKNIQPHFILNTLQSIVNWTKRRPDLAISVIEALAEEFRMINAISDKSFIPLHQEIDLCRTHLRLMSFRMGSSYRLETNGLCEQEQIPPLVFHTMVENALSHSFGPREDGTIRLICERTDRRTVYRLESPGSRLSELARKSEGEIRDGMGLRYVKARLEESYPGRWELESALDDDLWRVTIRLRH